MIIISLTSLRKTLNLYYKIYIPYLSIYTKIGVNPKGLLLNIFYSFFCFPGITNPKPARIELAAAPKIASSCPVPV